jgi:hypothetical protein
MCGHESPPGSAFCLNCGSSLAPAFGQTPGPPPGLPAQCGVCRAENPPGMKFCRSCGSALAGGVPSQVPVPATMMAPSPEVQQMIAAVRGGQQPPPPQYAPPPPMQGYGQPMPQPGAFAPPPTLPPPQIGGAKPVPITCPRCGTSTPSTFAYCQQCGLHLQGMSPTDPVAASGRARTPSNAPPMGAPPMGAVPMGAPPMGAVPMGAPPMARPPAPMSPPGGGRPPSGVRDPASGPAAIPIDVQATTLAAEPTAPARPAPLPSLPRQNQAAPQAAPAWGSAVLVNRDGTDGQRYPLAGEYLVIGRSGADIEFSEDRFLARQHARLERAGDGSVRVIPIDTLNGVFRKADAPVDLADGATILVGREVLRFERLDAEETKVAPLVRHGVALFGSPPREPWGRLLVLVPNGGHRDVRNLNDKEVVLGREEGEIVFRDDAFMSRRHAAITWDGRRVQITDLGSSNGTFVRVAGPTSLKHGDHVRMGDQLLRIELGR